MNGKYLLDTNIVIGYTKNAQPLVNFINQRQEANFYASVITRLELLSFPGLTQRASLITLDRRLANIECPGLQIIVPV